MKVKIEYVVLVAVIAGLSAYLLTRQSDRTHYELPQLAPIDTSAITRIEVAGPDGKFELTKADDTWSVGPQKYRADRTKVGPMIDTITGLVLTALVSESKDNHRYELDDEKKITVTAWGGEAAAREFDIGKAAPSFRHTFVRLAGDPNIYQASDNFRRKFEYSAEELRDKVILSFAASDVKEIKLSQGGETLTLLRKEVPLKESGETDQSEGPKGENSAAEPLKGKMSWLTDAGHPADSDKVDQLVAMLSQLSCDKYLPDKNKADFSEPIYTIEVKGQQTYRLAIFAKEKDSDTSHPAASSEAAEAFDLAEANAKRLMTAFGDIVGKPIGEEKSSAPDKSQTSAPQAN
jgi:hypothetical protein